MSTYQELPSLKRWSSFCRWLCVVYLFNFLLFVGMTLYLGGDAINGKFENGHYYLFGYISNSGGKGYTEETPGIFTYSKWHSYSAMLGALLCVIASYVASRLKAQISTLENRSIVNS